MAWVKTIDFMHIAPYVRLIQEICGDDKYKVPNRMIYDHELIFVLEGTCHYWIEGEQYVLRAGDMHYMPPHTEHYCYVPQGGNFRYFAVHFDWIYMGAPYNFSEDVYLQWDYIRMDRIPVQQELSDRPIVKFGDVDIPYVVSLRDPVKYEQPFRELMSVYRQKSFGYHLGMRSCLLKIMGWLMEEVTARHESVPENDSISSYIDEIIRYLRRHYRDNIDIGDLATLVHLSPNYLRVLFKKHTGQTILEYLNGLRMEKAKELLLQRKHTITEISFMVGYQDIHYFSKLFKKFAGQSPKGYAHTSKRSYSVQA